MIEAAGGIVWRVGPDGEREVLVGHRPNLLTYDRDRGVLASLPVARHEAGA